MDDVEAHVARAREPHHGVEVGAVVVERRPDPVHDPAISSMLGSNSAERVGVGEHQAGDVRGRPWRAGRRGRRPPSALVASLTTSRPAIVTVAGLVPCAVSGVSTLRAGLAAVLVVGARASSTPASSPWEPAEGCSETWGSPAISAERPLQVPHQLQRPLRTRGVLQRVQPGVAGQRRDALVQARVVLHRAGAERVEAGVEVEVALRDAHVVTHDLGLGDLGQPRRRGRGAGARAAAARDRPRARRAPGTGRRGARARPSRRS